MTESPQAAVKEIDEFHHTSRSPFLARKKLVIILVATIIIIALALGIGLGVGLTQNKDSSDSSDSSSSRGSTTPIIPITNNTNATSGIYWQPKAGATWQMVLEYALNDTSVNASIYDIDLFDNPASIIDELHAMNRSVICYFSAGSYEDFRPDSENFTKSDYDKPLDAMWVGEWWLDTNSTNVRSIMVERLKLAKEKGCDGVDPDNVDGYSPRDKTGFNLTPEDSIDYLAFLATEAHALGLAIGLKNAGDIVNATVGFLQWEVNEQCVEYSECGDYRPFIDAGKPVFHVEYPETAPVISQATRDEDCGDPKAVGFSSIMKKIEADNFTETC